MRSSKCNKLFAISAVILTSLFATFVINSTPVSAFVRVRNMNPVSIEYSTTYNGTKTTLSLGSQQNTPLTFLQTTSSKSIFLRRINFTRNLSLSSSTNQTIIIPLIIRTFTPNSYTAPTTSSLSWSQFHCPTAEYANQNYSLIVNQCDLKSSNIVNLPGTSENDATRAWSQNIIMSEYLVDIYISIQSGSDTNPYIDFVDTPIFSFLKTGSDNVFNSWQIGFSGMPYVIEPDPNPVADELEEQNDKDDQDRSDMSNQQNSVDSGSDSSQQAAESTGTTLLAAFSSFVTAITSARPSNCRIDMDMGNLDLGLVDFCQLSPPPAFQTLSSIFLILFCVPLSFSTARKVISLFRSFQK